jgi:hypothetical protein
MKPAVLSEPSRESVARPRRSALNCEQYALDTRQNAVQSVEQSSQLGDQRVFIA